MRKIFQHYVNNVVDHDKGAPRVEMEYATNDVEQPPCSRHMFKVNWGFQCIPYNILAVAWQVPHMFSETVQAS